MDVARVERSTTHIWAATPRAAARLELCGWQVVLFSEEELGRVDPNLPGFLEPLPVRTVSLRGPEVVDTAGEGAESERAAS
jgi:hypothetical protein